MIIANSKILSKRHRGVIGVESSILTIAFFMVSAAMAFVALETGYATTGEVQTATGRSLEDTTSNIQISGSVVGFTNPETVDTPSLSVITIPIKILANGGDQSLDESFTTVRLLTETKEYSNIYIGTIHDRDYRTPYDAFDTVVTEFSTPKIAIRDTPLKHSEFLGVDDHPITDKSPHRTFAVVYWPLIDEPSNDILESGEHAVLAIVFSRADSLQKNDHVTIEMSTLRGTTLTIERDIPVLSGGITLLS